MNVRNDFSLSCWADLIKYSDFPSDTFVASCQRWVKQGPDKKRDSTAHLTPALPFRKRVPTKWMAGQQVPTSRPQTPEMKGPICLPSFSEEKMLSLARHVSAVFPSLMVVKHSGDQKRHREMWKRHGEEVASRRCEVGTAGSGWWRAGAGGVQTVSIRPCHLTCGPLSVNVLHRRLTEAIIPVAHRDPQPSSDVRGTARLS